MGKNTFFTGQPIFSQVLRIIPAGLVQRIVRESNSDRYCKSFKTYDHLVTMLYGIYNQCTSLREISTGMLAWDHRIRHLGIDFHPRRSTLADANKRRDPAVFERIYLDLLSRYKGFLPDSRNSTKQNLYLFDSTSITLFQEILKGAGQPKKDGRRKGGIKVHTLLNASMDVPTMICLSAGVENDMKFLKEVHLPKGSVIVFDKGYRAYSSYNRFAKEKITWVTRHKDNSVFRIKAECPVNEIQRKKGVTSDWSIELGEDHPQATKVQARMIWYEDVKSKRKFCFITNNETLAPFTIAEYYRKRWQIELFFKRIKQNFQMQYFLGDNENAIKTQIWCVLIADLLLKIIKKSAQTRMSFSNIVGLIRLHLMTYMDLGLFMKNPEKILLKRALRRRQELIKPSLFLQQEGLQSSNTNSSG